MDMLHRHALSEHFVLCPEQLDLPSHLATKKQRSQCWAIPADLSQMLKQIGPALPELWNQGVLCWSQKKSLFRCLVEKVVLKRDNDQVAMRIVWRGGDVTEQTVRVTVRRFAQLSDAKQIEETIVAMTKQGHTDKQIAAHLTQAGHRSPHNSTTMLPSTVASMRRLHGILHRPALSRPHSNPGYLRPRQLAKLLQIKPYWIYDRIRNGTIQLKKHPKYDAYLFPDQPDTVEQFKRLIHGDVATLAY